MFLRVHFVLLPSSMRVLVWFLSSCVVLITEYPQGPQQPTLEDLWFAAAYKGIKSTQRQRRPPALPLADWSLAAPAAQVAAHVDGAEGAIGEQARQLVYPLSHHRADSAGVLEPLPALHEDDFLRGPGGPPLSEESRKHLLVFGLDYKETLSPRNRREWAPMERERWGRSRLLRYLIKTQQVRLLPLHAQTLYPFAQPQTGGLKRP